MVTHLAALVVLLVSPMLSESVKGTLGIADEKPQPREQLTYLALPPDEQVVQTRPKTNALSDKDRQAQPDLETPLKLPPLPRLAPPAEPTPPAEKKGDEELLAKAQQPRRLPPGNAGQQQSPTPQPGQPAPSRLRLENLTTQPPKLTLPTPVQPRSRAGGNSARDGPQPCRRPGLSDLSDPGGERQPGRFKPRGPGAVGDARILTDTLGVDFDPYLRRVVSDIRKNWFAVMPEIARLGKRGEAMVVFEILRDGEVPRLDLVSASGSEPLDRAALAGVSASVPFPPLPAQFDGPLIRIRVTFLYNTFYQ